MSGPAHAPDHSAHIKSVELERLIFFSDAVFAIAITLLVLEIRAPARFAGDADAQLVDGLVRLLPHLVAYAISFWIIGLYWFVHHRVFRHIRAWDDGLIWHNFHFLFWVAFLPFPVALIGQWGDRRLAVVIYAGTLAFMGVAQLMLWRHASRDRRLIDPHFDPELARFITLRSYIPPLAALLVVALALVWRPTFAWLGFWLIFVLQSALKRRYRRVLERNRYDAH